MAGAYYDWTKIRKKINEGGDLWEEKENPVIQEIEAARKKENAAYQKQQAAKKVASTQSSGKPFAASTATKRPYTSMSSLSKYTTSEDSLINPAKAFGEALVNKEYQDITKKMYKNDISERYKKVSNYTPKVKIVKQDTLGGKLSAMDKFANQTLGVFGNIKNLKKPKTVYQYRAEKLQDPVTGDDLENVWENILQINVVAEDKDFYYYRTKANSSGGGSIQSVKKEHVKEKLPDLEEQRLAYMAAQVNNKKSVASLADKLFYNVGEGMRKMAMGSKTKAQIPTGNKALDIASNIGGEILGFGVPTGGGFSLAKGLEQTGEKVLGGAAKIAPKAISKQLTGGIGKAVTKGTVEMGAYSGLENMEGEKTEDKVKQVLTNMFMGGAFMGGAYVAGKGASKIINAFKKIPETPDTLNLVNAAKEEFMNAKEESYKAVSLSEQESIVKEAEETFMENINTIGKKYNGIKPTPEEIVPSKTENVLPSKVKEKLPETNVNDTKINELNTRLNSLLDTQKTAPSKEIEVEVASIKKKLLDLQLLGSSGQSTTPPGVNPNILKTKEHIVSNSDIKKKTFKEKWESLYTQIIDRNRRLQTVSEAAGKGEKSLTVESPYKMSNIASAYEGIAKSNIEQGIADKNGKIVGEGLGSILKKVPKGKDGDMQDYIMLKQAAHLLDTQPEKAQVYPKEWGLTSTDMKAKIKMLEQQNPEFKGLARKYTNYNEKLTRTQLVDSGLLSEAEYQKARLVNPYYAPNKRLMADVEKGKSLGTKASYVGQNKGIKSRQGSERQLLSPFESSIENTFNYAKAAKRNEVGQTLYTLMAKNPEKLKPFGEIVKKEPDTLLQSRIQEGDLIGFIDDINAGFEIKGIKDLSKPNIVRIRIKGKDAYMQINDATLLDNLTYLNTDQINSFVETTRALTGGMKALTTGINPMFGLARNVWRDVVTGYVQSKTTSKIPVASYATYMKDLVGSVIGSTLKSKNYKEYRSLGGGFFSSAIGTDKNLLKETVQKYTGKTLKNKAKNLAKSPITFLEWANNTLETAPRYAEYSRTLKKMTKQGVDEYSAKMEGIYNGQEVTVNFKRSGEFTKGADAFVPYLNAAVQGIDKTLRTLDPRNPKELANVVSKGITSITVPSLLLYAVNHKNADYQKLSDYIKDNNFLIPYGKKGEFIKIPKPREFGILFGSLPERLMREFSEKDPDAFKNFSEAVKQNFLPPNIITDNMAAPIIRNVMSEEGRTWRGTPVVSRALLSQSPKNQYDENTSAIAKFIGKGLDFAPKKVDEIMKSYLGGAAQIAIPATSSRALNEKGVIKAAIEVLKKQVTADSKYSTDVIDVFYTNMQNANMKKADMTQSGKLKGKGETYIDSATYVFNMTSRQISDLRKEQKAAKSNEEKDKIQNQMIDIMKKANEDYKNNYLKKKKMETVQRKRDFKRSE